MANKKISKTEAKNKIESFFGNIKNKTPKEIKKIKKLAMHHHVSLNTWKEKYCKKCFSIFTSENSEIRIKNKFKNILCKKCGFVTRKKIKKVV